MRRSDNNYLKNETDQPVQNGKVQIPPFDQMSLHFVIPLVSFYAVIGLLLLLLNDWVTNVAAWAVAAGLILFGGWFLLRYIRFDIRKRLAGADMAMGLVLLLAGILLICSPSDMREVFPKIWGLSLIFGGFLKIQYAFDEKSVKVQRWWIMLIFSAVSLAIGILALLNKSVFGDNQHTVIGIFMVGEAILDLVTYFLLSRGMKLHSPAVASVPAAASDPVPVSAPVPQPEPESTVSEDE